MPSEHPPVLPPACAPHPGRLHVAAMLAEARALADSAAPELPRAPALLFCGDLNSDLNDGMPGKLTYCAKSS